MSKRSALILVLIFVFTLSVYSEGKKQRNFYLKKFSIFNRRLKTFSAKFIQRKYINIIDDFDDTQEGYIFLKRKGKDIFIKRVVEKPGKIFLLVKNGLATIYYPKRAQVIKKSFGKSKSEYLTLGLGSDIKVLEKNFKILYSGKEKIKGRMCGILSLLPRSEKLKSYFKKIDLWIDSKSGEILRQKVYENNGDYTVIEFKNIKVNCKIKDSLFKLKIPKGVDVIS